MALSNLFKPKWKHSNPQKRIEAINVLNSKEIFEKIIEQEKDRQVRQVAIEKYNLLVATGLCTEVNQLVVINKLAPIHNQSFVEQGPRYTHIYFDYYAAESAYNSLRLEVRFSKEIFLNNIICKACEDSVLEYDASKSTRSYSIACCKKCYKTFLYKIAQ